MGKVNIKKELLSKIETKDEATKIIKDCSNAFLVLAAIQIIGGFVIGDGLIFDGILYLILSLILKKLNSRIVAILLLLLSLFSVVITAINMFGGGQGGKNILLALLTTWAGVRAVQATYVYNKIGTLPDHKI